MEYMSKLYGKSDENKIKLIADLQSDYNRIEKNLAELENEYSNKEITTAEYEKRKKELSEFSSYGSVVDYLSSCTYYVKENTARHYFIDYMPWTQVFQNYGFDFLLMLCVLVMSVNAVMIEFNADMTIINSVSVKGNKYSGISKIIVVIIATAIITLILSAIYISVFSFKYNLTGFDYPLESLKSYSGSVKGLTIGKAYLLLTVVKIFGYCSFAVFTIFFSVLIKKSAPTMTLSLALVLAPMYILNSETEGQLRYLLPLPLGAMMSTGYIKGTDKSDYTGDFFFREISYFQMFLVFAILFIITIVMSIYVSKKLSGKKLNIKFNKKAVMAFRCLCTAMLLCSCSANYKFEKADSSYVVDNDNNTVYSKTDDENVNINELPTNSPSQVGFVSGKNAVVKNGNTISLINLETYEKRELLQLGKNYEMSGFLGLEDLFPSLTAMSIDTSAENLVNLTGGKDSKLYFYSRNGTTEYDIITRKSTRSY
jgi:hypothetical protein